jgi:hypothetical protein
LQSLGYIIFWYGIWLVGVFFGAIKAYHALTGKIGAGLARNRARKLDLLQKKRDHLTRLRKCDREYYGRLLSGVLWVLTLFAVQVAFEGVLAQ